MGGMTWLKFGPCKACKIERSGTPDKFPIRCQLGCVKLKLLSRSHSSILLAFVLDVGLLALEAITITWETFSLVSINFVCVLSMLYWFEEMDDIARLERQINVYEQRNEEVGKRREEAQQNWDQVQELH